MAQFTSILVDVDALAHVHHELERAVNLARRCLARLTIVDSMTVPAYSGPALPPHATEDVVATRRRALDRLARCVSIPATSRLLVGPPATVLAEEVLRSTHDLLVRSHARDLTAASKPNGSINEELLSTCPCPVLLTGPGRTPERPRIVGVVRRPGENAEEDCLGRKVVDLTRVMARLENGTPSLLQTWVPFAEATVRTHAVDDAFAVYLEDERHRTADELARLRQSVEGEPLDVQTMSIKGTPEDIIPEFTVREGVDLVVTTTPMRCGALSRMFRGRASHRFLQRLTCSLLAVR